MDLKLPLGIQDFAALRRDGCVYVDMSLQTGSSPEALEESLRQTILDAARSLDVTVASAGLVKMFEGLLRSVAVRHGTPAVVIVDEYDKPIADRITDPPAAGALRDVLRDFYGVLKACDEHLRMVFLTGVSRFARVSIFSGLNQLRDLTLTPDVAEVCGYTAEELRRYLTPAVEALALRLKISVPDTWAEIERYYDGYWWGAGDRLYNPWSLLSSLADGTLRGYWFASGTPTLLVDSIREQRAAPEDFEGREVGELALEAADVDRWDLTALLWQTGYLTIREVLHGPTMLRRYRLGYPNLEVRQAWFERLMDLYLPRGAERARPEADAPMDALYRGDRHGFEQRIRALYSSIPHQIHLPREAYYHSLFHLTLALMGAEIRSEESTDKGRLDAVVETPNRVYVIEFKLDSPETAISQIESKGYADPWRRRSRGVTLLGVGGFAERAVSCRWKDLE